MLEKKVSEKLCHWLAVHQNTHTGLLPSFEGDADINDRAFTYDQALAAIAFTHQGQRTTRRIFDFYLHVTSMDDGGFANAYYASSGDIAEFMAHVVPPPGWAWPFYNTRIRQKTGNTLIWHVPSRAGLTHKRRGRRPARRQGLTGYSTEHNLDAYAFYNMFYQLTQETVYKQRAQELFSWLNKNAYSNIGNLLKEARGIQRSRQTRMPGLFQPSARGNSKRSAWNPIVLWILPLPTAAFQWITRGLKDIWCASKVLISRS